MLKWLIFLVVFWIPQAVAQVPVIMVFGDSLSAGYGLAPEQSWVSLLQQRLREQAYNYRVVNASISGDTTDSGQQRLGKALQRHQPAIVILELGGNDGLRGLPLERMQANLASMIRQSRERGSRVLLVGMEIPPNYGRRFSRLFRQSYEIIARQLDTPLVPFLLAGIEADRRYFQADQIHPNAQAQPILLDNIWNGLRPLL